MNRAGIRSVAARVPIGTSIEFNYVGNPLFEDLANLGGAYIPFHTTQAARVATGDTWPSLELLYGNQAGYVSAVRSAAQALVA